MAKSRTKAQKREDQETAERLGISDRQVIALRAGQTNIMNRIAKGDTKGKKTKEYLDKEIMEKEGITAEQLKSRRISETMINNNIAKGKTSGVRAKKFINQGIMEKEGITADQLKSRRISDTMRSNNGKSTHAERIELPETLFYVCVHEGCGLEMSVERLPEGHISGRKYDMVPVYNHNKNCLYRESSFDTDSILPYWKKIKADDVDFDEYSSIREIFGHGIGCIYAKGLITVDLANKLFHVQVAYGGSTISGDPVTRAVKGWSPTYSFGGGNSPNFKFAICFCVSRQLSPSAMRVSESYFVSTADVLVPPKHRRTLQINSRFVHCLVSKENAHMLQDPAVFKKEMIRSVHIALAKMNAGVGIAHYSEGFIQVQEKLVRLGYNLTEFKYVLDLGAQLNDDEIDSMMEEDTDDSEDGEHKDEMYICSVDADD